MCLLQRLLVLEANHLFTKLRIYGVTPTPPLRIYCMMLNYRINNLRLHVLVSK
jgi:hypothetical protein